MVAIAIAVKACRGDPKLRCQIHGFAITTGFMSYLSVSNSLMNMYCKSGQLNRASSILENLDNPDIVSYNTLLSGFENGEDALSFACGIHSVGVVFDAVTYTTILAHCTDHEEFHLELNCTLLCLNVGWSPKFSLGMP
ncbi:unnamed protein product [Ilex paraguariensis]|uniref:Pentatricopeptide repeat-containing protein n=1 Tax=Ilex paraguariensis TaxID=185542 RepID=A0ABC8RQA2_9AQUA